MSGESDEEDAAFAADGARLLVEQLQNVRVTRVRLRRAAGNQSLQMILRRCFHRSAGQREHHVIGLHERGLPLDGEFIREIDGVIHGILDRRQRVVVAEFLNADKQTGRGLRVGHAGGTLGRARHDLDHAREDVRRQHDRHERTQ